MTRSLIKSKGRRENGTFLLVPTDVLQSRKYRSLSFKAKALILDFGAQFTGFNNGHLAATWSQMKVHGWASKQTLQAALQELLETGLIEQTRQGGRNRCSLYAYTWKPIDIGRAGSLLDVEPTKVASGLWRQ